VEVRGWKLEVGGWKEEKAKAAHIVLLLL